jgi:hypothetical protein
VIANNDLRQCFSLMLTKWKGGPHHDNLQQI